MSIGSIIYRILIGPLELFFEVVFELADRHVSNPAYAIIMLSLAMNFLVLPLYRRADAVQAEERDRENALAPWIKHIKKTFKGDERFMMLQAYYRENNYKPTDTLKGSISLLLEIPFFIAAYRFLSGLETLRGVSFGPITDLGAPDALISIGSVTLNLLPILMTLINVISAAIYMKGFPLKSKVQMYGIAAIFLVFLYKSPAGLVFYWTLNNLFSLIKNIFYKIPHPDKVLKILASVTGAVLLVIVIFVHPMPSARAQAIVIAGLLCLQIPLIKGNRKLKIRSVDDADAAKVFYASSAFLTLLTGLLIPSSVIGASTEEFLSVTNYYSPYWYIVSALTIAFGTFFIWFGIFYRLASKEGKQIFSLLMLVLAAAAAVDYMFFGKTYGNFSSTLVYDETPSIGMKSVLINAAVLAAVALVIAFIFLKKLAIVKVVSIAMCLALVVMSGMNINQIRGSLAKAMPVIEAATENEPSIKLSKNGQNVVVIMMDRQIGHLIPFIMHERPELKKSFDGFTFYSNSVSFGSKTNSGSPALYGGYDYTPENMNEREEDSLAEKHNEALKVMPELFDKEGFDITICEPTYAGYSWIPDLRVFKDHPDWNCYLSDRDIPLEQYGYRPQTEMTKALRNRNFFCYGLFKIAPAVLQPTLYDHGNYNAQWEGSTLFPQARSGMSVSSGYRETFMEAYAFLDHLPEITDVSGSDKGTFFMMSNDTTHEAMLLQEPEYEPALEVDNSEFDRKHPVRTDDDGNEMLMPDAMTAVHYQSNMAAMLELAKWMDYLRKEGVYDNTRIIIVSDHGQDFFESKTNDAYKLYYENKDGKETFKDIMAFDCVLLVKDFGAKGFTTDDRMATNADVPALAAEGIVDRPKNPFTGNELTTYQQKPVDLNLLYSMKWDITSNNGSQYAEAEWFNVHDNIYDINNWSYKGTW